MSEAQAAGIASIPVDAYQHVDKNFSFKKDKLGEKRPTVTLSIPHITATGLITALQDEKQRGYVIDLVNDAIISAARGQVSNDVAPVNKQEELDLSKLTVSFLANEPKSERTGRGISKETWEAFSEDYAAVMPGATGKSAESVGRAVALFSQRLQPCKTNKPVLQLLRRQLDIWFDKTTNGEELADVYQFLSEKADTFLNTTDEELLANL